MKPLFKSIIGQEQAKKAITDWYLHEHQPLLIYGSSGFGKTLFAKSLGARIIDTTQMRGDRLNSILKPIKESYDGDILFLDEIHSLQPKILEGLYYIIDTGTFYDTDLCMNLPLPNVRFVFATNILDKLPVAFVNRCRMVELQEYTIEELKAIIHKSYSSIDKNALDLIVRASKGVPRTALSMAQSIISGAKTDAGTEEVNRIKENEVKEILTSRMSINADTGLTQKEFMIIQKVIERGNLSMNAVANLLKTTIKDATRHYINPLRAADWLAVSGRGVIPGARAHENYRIFMKRRDK